MKKILKNPLRISLLIVAAIVDIFSLIQIIRQTQFKAPALLNSPWFWLLVIVSLMIGALIVFFKWQDYKRTVAVTITAVSKELTDYRQRAHDEFVRVYKQISAQQEQINTLNWKLQEIQEGSKTNHSV